MATKRNPLIILLLTACALLLLANLLIAAWGRHLVYARKLQTIRNASQPNLLIVGNSLFDGHLDESIFSGAARQCGVPFTPLNAALGAVQPAEQRLLFQYATDRFPAMHTLVVGMFDFQLTTDDSARPQDLTGNRMVAIDRTVPMNEVTEAYQFGPSQKLEVDFLRVTPMVANRANAWRYVELLRRAMAQMGMPQVAVNSMGRVEDFAALEALSPEEFDRDAQVFLGNPHHFNRSFEFIFDQAHAAHMRTVVLIMPISPVHRALFYSRPSWDRYRDAVESLAHSKNIEFIDASSWLPAPGDFVDNLHMSPSGVAAFSSRLGHTLACSPDRAQQYGTPVE